MKLLWENERFVSRGFWEENSARDFKISLEVLPN
jgi:hypothetical protein